MYDNSELYSPETHFFHHIHPHLYTSCNTHNGPKQRERRVSLSIRSAGNLVKHVPNEHFLCDAGLRKYVDEIQAYLFEKRYFAQETSVNAGVPYLLGPHNTQTSQNLNDLPREIIDSERINRILNLIHHPQLDFALIHNSAPVCTTSLDCVLTELSKFDTTTSLPKQDIDGQNAVLHGIGQWVDDLEVGLGVGGEFIESNRRC
ncbi:hypothetical protein F5884DRAFT_760289 [Xylogone sp. PMI_703]|nr:hypothetical protein F5884DRAFT_760289 [Xylogone sp. PMI_703]